MNNTRKFQRYDINVPIRVEIMPTVGLAEKIDFEGINLAAGGMLIKTGKSLPEGSSVKIEITFNFNELKTPENPEGTLVLTVTGHVVRNEPEGTAIRFDENYEISQSLSFLLGKAPPDA
jgi:hypothetical protein